MTPPRCAFGAPPQGGAACGPAEPAPRRLLGWTGLCLGAALLTCLMPAQAQYKVIGPDGRVTYTDRPPTDAGHKVQAIRRDGLVTGEADATATLPLALRQPAARFPVLLVSGADCSPCDRGRQLLQARGIPFTERSVSSDDDSQALQRLTGALTLPSLQVGGQWLRGLLESEWQATLDLAGYPKESALPRNWRQAAATPLAPRGNAAQPAQAPAPTPAPGGDAARPAEAGSGPAIRF